MRQGMEVKEGQDTSSVWGRMAGFTFALQPYWKLGMGLNVFSSFPSAPAAEHGGMSGVCVTSWVDTSCQLAEHLF